MKTLTAVVIAIGAALTTSSAQAQQFTPVITQTVGTGSDESFFVINFEDSATGTNNPATDFAFGFRWNPSSAPTGNDMILALQSGTGGRFSVEESNDPMYGAFISGFSYGGVSQDGSSDPNGDWAYWTGTNGQTWTYSNVGASGRTLTNGSWDGWTWDSNYNNDPPTGGPGGDLFAPVTPNAAPEPSSLCVFALGASGLALMVRRRTRGAGAR